MPFRLEPSGDPVFPDRLILDGPAGGWVVLDIAAEALAPPLRPVMRLRTSDGVVQVAVLPGPALGRARWTGLLPDNTVEVCLSLGPGVVLERIGRRTEASIVLDCIWRRPGNAAAALYARFRGRDKRVRDTLRGGVAVTRQRRFAGWAVSRHSPFCGPVPELTVRCIVHAGGEEGRALSRTLAALERQTLAPVETAVFWGDRPEGAAGSIWDPHCQAGDLASGAEAILLVRAGDEPAPDALALLAATLGEADLAYADEIAPDGQPRLKPDWSPNFAIASGYVGRIALLSRGLLDRIPALPLGPLAEAAPTLGIAAALACRQANHRPRPLMRTAATDPVDRVSLLERCLEAFDSSARAIKRGEASDVMWPLPDPAPLASVVIPSRDRPDLIVAACQGVLEQTSYPAIELIVVDNGSTDPDVLSFYDVLRRDRRVRIVPYPHPFNFSAMVNAGVEVATGQVVVLLNNDIGVRGPGWLGEMVRQAIRPEVGAVGAKLLFGDGKLQHAGVVVGLAGRAGHILRRRPAETPGHLGRLTVAHEVSAVTAACLAVARDKYWAVEGFDAEAFPVDFNDVDFCLRVAAAGWTCLWTPAAELFHFESISRGPSVGAKRERFEREAAVFTSRWLSVIRHDPYYHPALSLTTFGEDLE